MNNNKKNSIFYKLLVPSLTFVFFILITLNVIFYFFSKNNIERHFREFSQQQIDRVGHNFAQIKSDLIVSHQILVANPIVDNFLMSPAFNYEINARALEKLLVEYIAHIESLESIYLVDYMGREKIRVDKATGRIKKYRDLSSRKLFKDIESNSQGMVGVGTPYSDKVGGVHFSTAVNIIDGDIGEFGGAIFIDYNFNNFLDSLKEIKINKENTVWVFSPDGKALNRPLNIDATFDPEPYMSKGFHYMAEFRELDEGMLAYQDFSILPDQPFVRVAITIPYSFILEDLREVARYSLYLFFVFTFVAIIGVFYLSKHFTRPIVELSHAATKLAKGDLKTKVGVKATGEVKTLINSFNRMASDLELFQEKIMQRNEELDATNEELAATVEALDDTNIELNNMNEELEHRVSERTKALNEAQTIAKLGSWKWDMVTNEVQWSDEAYNILGMDPKDTSPTYEQYSEMVHSDDKDHYFASTATAMDEKQTNPKPLEYRIILPDGEVKNILDLGIIYYDKDDKPVRMTGTIQDVTDRKRSEKEKEELWSQLLQSQKMESIGILSGRVAHDFNNMLTPIVGYSSLAYDMLEEGSDVREMVGRIQRTGKKASHLIDQLLTFSRMQVYANERLDFKQVVEDMQYLINSVIGEDVELVVTVADGLSEIYGDLTQLQQVILNLVVNARQAMEEGGTLGISAEAAVIGDEFKKTNKNIEVGDYILLSVSDTGAGMNMVTQAKMFDPFFTTKQKEKGSGLGLSTVYGIVKQHNGFILCDSEPEKGSVFKVYLPVAEEIADEDRIEKTIKEPEEEIDLNGTETILVVDDKTNIHKLIGDILRPKGYKIAEADCAESAIKTVDSIMQYDGDIDLLMTDVVMPGMNGWELYQEVKKVKPEIKVLFTSGFIENAVVLHDIQEKGYPFIKKPIDPNDLLKNIRQVLNKDS